MHANARTDCVHQTSNLQRPCRCTNALEELRGIDCHRCGRCKERGVKVVDHDGITNSSARDGPGQSCHYILSGNHELEVYRTATFAKYPEDVPVFPIALAKAGFYFTGYKDRVRCFSCGMTVENWIVGDDVFLPTWHKQDCAMCKEGGDPRNVPTMSVYPTLCGDFLTRMQSTTNRLRSTGQQQQQQHGEVTARLQNVNIATNVRESQPGFQFAQFFDEEHGRLVRGLDLKKEEERRKTFEKWPSYPAPYLPGALAQNGFFYLGNLDRAQCIFCSGVLRNWAPADIPEEQHRRHFPHCRFLAGTANENVPMTDQARRDADAADHARRSQLQFSDEDPIVEPPNPPAAEQQRLARLYFLNNPVSPHMESLQSRLRSFDSRWPGTMRATTEQIAKAGFFFLGESDKTKCYYCNGGLQNWDRNDEPWTEHAKWFPGCAFVIRNKGQEFVRRLYHLHPNLNRPTIRHPVSFEMPMNARPTEQPTDINVHDLMGMGFPEDRVRRMMQRKMTRDGRGYESPQDLIDDLLRESPEANEVRSTSPARDASGENDTPVSAVIPPVATNVDERNNESENGKDIRKRRTPSSIPSGESSSATTEMQETVLAKQETARCRYCKLNVADTVLMPCGHLVSCFDCAKKEKRCCVCKAKVQNHLKVYRA